MSAAAADLLAGWRATRAARAAEFVPGVPGAQMPPGTAPNPQETAIVPGVPGVPDQNEEVCTEQDAEPLPAPDPLAARAAFYLAFMAEAAAALAGREPDPIEEAERAAVFGGEAEPRPQSMEG